jgi:hypothetical protein
MLHPGQENVQAGLFDLLTVRSVLGGLSITATPAMPGANKANASISSGT